jgi:hypothetical protein
VRKAGEENAGGHRYAQTLRSNPLNEKTTKTAKEIKDYPFLFVIGLACNSFSECLIGIFYYSFHHRIYHVFLFIGWL